MEGVERLGGGVGEDVVGRGVESEMDGRGWDGMGWGGIGWVRFGWFYLRVCRCVVVGRD